MRPGKRRALDTAKPMEALTEQMEPIKAGIRARVEHSFRVLKRQFGNANVRYRGLAKYAARLHTAFGLTNLSMVCRKLLGALARWAAEILLLAMQAGHSGPRGSETR